MNRDDINKVAAWMMANGYATGHGETMDDLLDELKWQIDEQIAIEREACAALCDAEAKRVRDLHDRLDDGCIDALLGKELSAKRLAEAIRSRGQK